MIRTGALGDIPNPTYDCTCTREIFSCDHVCDICGDVSDLHDNYCELHRPPPIHMPICIGCESAHSKPGEDYCLACLGETVYFRDDDFNMDKANPIRDPDAPKRKWPRRPWSWTGHLGAGPD